MDTKDELVEFKAHDFSKGDLLLDPKCITGEGECHLYIASDSLEPVTFELLGIKEEDSAEKKLIESFECKPKQGYLIETSIISTFRRRGVKTYYLRSACAQEVEVLILEKAFSTIFKEELSLIKFGELLHAQLDKKKKENLFKKILELLISNEIAANLKAEFLNTFKTILFEYEFCMKKNHKGRIFTIEFTEKSSSAKIPDLPINNDYLHLLLSLPKISDVNVYFSAPRMKIPKWSPKELSNVTFSIQDYKKKELSYFRKTITTSAYKYLPFLKKLKRRKIEDKSAFSGRTIGEINYRGIVRFENIRFSGYSFDSIKLTEVEKHENKEERSPEPQLFFDTCDFNGCTFKKHEFHGVRFEGCNIDKCAFKTPPQLPEHSNQKNSSKKECQFVKSTIKCDFKKKKNWFSNKILKTCTFAGHIYGMDLTGASLNDVTFEPMNQGKLLDLVLNDTKIESCTFKNLNFGRSSFVGSEFSEDCKFINCSFGSADDRMEGKERKRVFDSIAADIENKPVFECCKFDFIEFVPSGLFRVEFIGKENNLCFFDQCSFKSSREERQIDSFVDLDFSHTIFSSCFFGNYTDFEACKFMNVTFMKCTLQGQRFDGSSFKDAVIDGGQWIGIHLSGEKKEHGWNTFSPKEFSGEFHEICFNGTKFHKAFFEKDTLFQDVTFHGCQFQKSIFEESKFIRLKLDETSLKSFIVSALQGARFIDMHYTGRINTSDEECKNPIKTVVNQCDLTAAKFEDCFLSNINFDNDCVFYGAELLRVDFHKCKFKGANFTAVIHEHGKYEECKFQNSNLKDIQFENIYFIDTQLVKCTLDASQIAHSWLEDCLIDCEGHPTYFEWEKIRSINRTTWKNIRSKRKKDLFVKCPYKPYDRDNCAIQFLKCSLERKGDNMRIMFLRDGEPLHTITHINKLIPYYNDAKDMDKLFNECSERFKIMGKRAKEKLDEYLHEIRTADDINLIPNDRFKKEFRRTLEELFSVNQGDYLSVDIDPYIRDYELVCDPGDGLKDKLFGDIFEDIRKWDIEKNKTVIRVCVEFKHDGEQNLGIIQLSVAPKNDGDKLHFNNINNDYVNWKKCVSRYRRICEPYFSQVSLFVKFSDRSGEYDILNGNLKGLPNDLEDKCNNGVAIWRFAYSLSEFSEH